MRFAALTFVFLATVTFAAGDMYLKRSEDSEVPVCEQFDICNLVHKPRWGDSMVEKLCNCPEGSLCPTNFSPNDGKSLLINARSQMKFCEPLIKLQADLEMCDENDTAILVKTVYQADQIQNVSARINCNCNHDGPNYWQYNSRKGQFLTKDEKLFEVVDSFECSELPKCARNEFCGFARMDYGFIFQRCTCCETHDCKYYLDEADLEEDVESELFYSGRMLKSRCIRKDDPEDI